MEIFDQASYEPVTATQKALEAVDFGSQAFVRPINLFYLQKNKRSRIIAEEDGTFSILDTDLKFTKQKLRELLHEHPERFSPNVVMRPIYQELILPNLAYIGGGGEISYWLERKTQFELFGINFPMLIRRNSALWINHYQAKKIRKLGLSIQDTFTETEELIKTYVRRNSENDLDLENELGQLETVFESYGQKANQVDPTLKPRALAIGAKYKKQIEKLAKRLMREEKRKHEAAIYNIRQIKHELFPNDGLQERKANFLNFYAQEGQYFFDSLKEHLHPLEHGMVVFEED
ncbi:MAG: bacillithiol biosynthesis BshC, partial [Bacteroidota bacterium]